MVRCIEEAGEIPENRYASEGLRHEMEENGRLVQFLYSGKEVVAEKEDDGNVIRYIRGYQLISSDNEKAKVYYHYASDELGSVTHIVNGNVKRSPYKLEYGMRIAGSDYEKKEKKNNCFSIINRKKVADNDFRVMNRYEYDAFGNTVKCEEKVHNRFRFAGEQYDPLTQQYYLRARFYNPVIGRFIQEDNYYGDGLNLYAYCKNNPVKYIDPSGHGTTSAADKEANEKNANDLKDYIDELNQGDGASPEDIEALRELAEEFGLEPNELNILTKQEVNEPSLRELVNEINERGGATPSEQKILKEFADDYGIDYDSLGVSENTNGDNFSRFQYEHNPMENPKAANHIVENPDAIYGFSPDPNSERIGEFAEYDWTDINVVSEARAARLQYHRENESIYNLVNDMKAKGYSIEEIARAANQKRNANRLQSYIDNGNMKGYEKAVKSNMENFGNKYGMTPEQAFEKYGSWEMVLEKAMSANAGMDACCGLYDEFYDLYPVGGE